MPYANILLHHAFSQRSGPLTYAIPKTLKIEEGSLVLVPFRKQKKTGVVIKIHEKKPNFPIKEIEKVCFEAPALLPWQMSLLEWLQEYYFCDPYRAVKLLLPSVILREERKARRPKDLSMPPPNIPEEYSHYCHSEPLRQAQGKTPAKNLTPNTPLAPFFPSQNTLTLFHHPLSETRFETYAELAREQWKNGCQTLILIAEMSMATEKAEIFQKHFQEKVFVFGSNITEKEKANTWLAVRNITAPVIIGSRSALFLPFPKLGLIIIDQEHDLISYKQEQSPRYSAKTVAKKITELTGANLILASHAPSITNVIPDSTHGAMRSASSLQSDDKAFSRSDQPAAPDQESYHEHSSSQEQTIAPKFFLINLCDEAKKHNFSPISDTLQEKMSQTLEKGQQVLLFLNKKGSSATIVCRECGEHLKCKNCLHRTSFYRTKNLLKCNKCGWEEPAPLACPHCKGLSLKMLGFGTEKLEKEVQNLFPQAKTLRVDTDALKSQKQFSKIYEKIEKKETEIIIGTQLLFKKEKYPHVGLVAVVLADTAFAHHDFRSEERAYQMFTNLFLLKTAASEIIIQTYRPKNATLNFAMNNDYAGFYTAVSASRRKFGYPPFTELIKLTIENADLDKNRKNAETMKVSLEKIAQNTAKIALLPANPPYLRGRFRHTLLIRGKNLHSLIKKTFLGHSTGKFFGEKFPLPFKIDIDPIEIP